MAVADALLQEAGIIIHSIFVGIAYGASTDYGVIRALTIALGFHQVQGFSCTMTGQNGTLLGMLAVFGA